MMIVVGGILGSGRHALARALATDLGFYYFDMRETKLRQVVLDRGQAKEQTVRPRSDQDALHSYRIVVQQFPLLSKMHPDLVLDDSLHRRATRTFLLEAAAPYFGPVFFVWVKADAHHATKRIAQMAAQGVIVNRAEGVAIRKKCTALFQSYPVETLVFENNLDPAAGREQFVALVRDAIGARIK